MKKRLLLALSIGLFGFTLVGGLLATAQSAQAAPAPILFAQADPAEPPAGEGETEEETSCESRGAIAWLLCPIILTLDSAMNWVDTQIARLLEIDTTIYDNDSMKAAWASIRNIAFIILVPIMLVMIIGTAIGSSTFDAYTVKKALPRMVVAVLFITLSFIICTFLIQLSNVVGAGTLGLLTAPFKFVNDAGETVVVSGLSLADLFDGGNPLKALLFLPNAIAAGIGFALFVWFFGSAVLLFVAIAFIVLLARQLFVVALVLLAPLAILSWIFPGNDKFWKGWWSLFSKLLIMFPLIMALLAAGRIFAVILNEDRGGSLQGTFLTPIAKLAVYVLPYALIPFTFKFAGGLFATVSGMANDKSKGLSDRMRKGRANKMERLSAGNAIRNAPEGSLRSRINRAGEVGMNARQAGLNPRHMRSRMRTALNDSAEAEVPKFMEGDSFKTWGGDDALVSAGRFDSREDIGAELARFDPGRFAGEANRTRREEAINRLERSKREVGNETFQRARVRAQAKTGTGYQYTDANGQTQFDSSRMIDDINAAYGNDRGGAGKALAEMRGSLAQSGQIAGMAGYGTWAEQMDNRYNGTQTAQGAHNAIMDDTINSIAPGQAVYGKPASAAAVGAAHARRIQTIAAGVTAGTHTQDDLNAAVAGAAGIYDAMSQASPQNASAMANELMGQQINAPILTRTYSHPQTGAPVTENLQSGTVREYIQALGQADGNAEFLDRRRELTAAALSQAQAAQQAAAAAGGGGLPGAPQPPLGGGPGVLSDQRLKCNVTHLVTTDSGIKLYSFQYIWSEQVYVGVMAQDLIYDRPEVLSLDSSGFYAVDYEALGLEMLTLEEWESGTCSVILR